MPLVPVLWFGGTVLLAGFTLNKLEDVLDASTRLLIVGGVIGAGYVGAKAFKVI